MIKYTIEYIDNLKNEFNDIDENDQKYHNLIDFINTMYSKKKQIDRTMFGNNIKKTYFKQASNDVEKITITLNGIIGKINDTNKSEIMKQLKMLKFDKITDCTLISNNLHRSMIMCQKYMKYFTDVIDYIEKSNPLFGQSFLSTIFTYLDNQMNGYVTSILSNDDDKDKDEDKFSIKKNIMANFDLIILMCQTNTIINLNDINNLLQKFDSESDNLIADSKSTADEIINCYTNGDKICDDKKTDNSRKNNLSKFSFELLLRFIKKLNETKIGYNRSIKDKIKSKEHLFEFPGKKFLLMDINKC